MKFTFISDRCTALTDLIDEIDGLEVKLIYDKMAHITNNFDRIREVALEQARNEEEKVVISQNFFGIDEIQIDLDNAYDEFYFLSNGEYLNNICCHIEVVIPEVAEENDKEWIKGTPSISLEERETYKLGEVLSDYSKLSDKYYFKFM
jgi:hypothetical protein